MGRESIIELINKAKDEAFFVGKADNNKISFIEEQLKVQLPESYKWFLREFGHGGLDGFMIIGNGKSDIPATVGDTKQWRKYGLEKELVVIEDDGTDWIYCLDTSKLQQGECPVVDWSQGKGIGKEEYANFYEFFESKIISSGTYL